MADQPSLPGRSPDPTRVGPRPLSLCLQLAAAESARSGAAVDAGGFLAGLNAYWRHPYRRRPHLLPVLWRDGPARLLDYGVAGDPPVLVVPSLINRAYILDLMPGRSLLAHLAGAGLRPLLLDWGLPEGAELSASLESLVLGRAGRALNAARAATDRPPLLLGYCMGGLLALALAAARRDDVAGLALLATPWDFHATAPRLDSARVARPSGAIAALGHAPVELLQCFFMSLDGPGVVRKFRHFAALPAKDPRTELFVAIEDWLSDGVPLAGPAAQACLWHWYVENRPARRRWDLAGVRVRPKHLRLPVLIAAPGRDRIVPAASAEALAAQLDGPTLLRPATGHVGMVVGSSAETQLWAPLAAWLRRTAAATESGRSVAARGHGHYYQPLRVT